MTIDEIVRWVIDTFEGHLYTDDPLDTGGATRYGITLRTLQYYRRKISGDPTRVVTKADVRSLTLDEAVACGVEVFAVEPKIDQLVDWRVQLVVYDYGFHSGGARAIKALQQELGIGQDGVIGTSTIKMEADFPGDQRFLALDVLTAREEFMQSVMEARMTQRKWMFGWWKRTTKLQRLIVT